MNQLQISERKEILCVTRFNNAERREFYSHICPNHIQSVAVIVTDVVEVVVTVVGLVVVDLLLLLLLVLWSLALLMSLSLLLLLLFWPCCRCCRYCYHFCFCCSSNSFLLLPSVMQMRNSSPFPPLRVILWIMLFSLST